MIASWEIIWYRRTSIVGIDVSGTITTVGYLNGNSPPNSLLISLRRALHQNYREIMDKKVRKKIKEIGDKQIRENIVEIIGHMQCPKDFKCANSGFKRLCKARDCGMDHYLECLEDKPLPCKFVIIFGDQYFCQCPLRVYISKQFDK